ncbi:uncharacterized protein METZ01_LOCUS190791, partial [marine metagenome]
VIKVIANYSPLIYLTLYTNGLKMKKLILLITLFSILIPRELMLKTDDALSARNAHHSSQGINVDRQNNIINNDSSREDIPLFEWDFEGDTWNADSGWELTETSYNSETHSYLSPNTAATLNASWNLTSDIVALPALGDGEIMRFKFWLYGDMPDTDGDNDSYLDDYYQLSIMDLEALSWHASADAPNADGSAYWCSDEAIGPNGGYLDEWM